MKHASVRGAPTQGLQPAIPLLLQHDCFCSDQAIVCALLRSSKTLQEECVAYCNGRLAVTWSLPGQQKELLHDSTPCVCYSLLPMDEKTPHAKYFAGWLAKHAALARSLTLPWQWTHYSSSWQRAAAADLATGLQAAAAAGPAGLGLQALSACSIEAPILEHLPANQLTSLNLSHHGKLCGVAAVNAALLRLTNLRSLSLSHASRPHDASSDGFLHNLFGAPAWTLRRLLWEGQDDACLSCDALLPGLAAMRQLTR